MMDSFRNASKNTLFEQWLDATKQPPPAAASTKQGAPSRQDVAPRSREAVPLHELAQYLAEEKVVGVGPLPDIRSGAPSPL